MRAKHTTHGIFVKSVGSKLAEHLPSGRTFIDLGSGDGTVVHEAQELGANAIGFETDEELWKISKNLWPTAMLIHGDFMDIDLSGFDYAYYYVQGTTKEAELAEKLNKEFTGTLLVHKGIVFDDRVAEFTKLLKCRYFVI